MGRFKAKCENCKGGKQLSETLCSYRLADGSTLNILKTFAWCSQCMEVVWAERIPDPSELSDTQQSEWRKSRESPSKCLSCGSTDLIFSRRGQTNSGNEKYEIDCPRCDGLIWVLREPVLSLDRSWILYTPEGDLIQDYEMSPSKGAFPKSKKP